MPLPNAWLRLLVAPLAFAAACESSSEEDPIEFDEPQIVPQTNVLCLSYDDLVAGSPWSYSVQLTNRGRRPLVIRGAAVENDARGAFRIERVRSVDRVDCTAEAPCSIPSTQDAFLQYTYTPPAPGWDTADLRVFSNAQNYPRLRIFVLARARPDGVDAGVPYDAGPKPANAVGADGTESCPDQRPDAGS